MKTLFSKIMPILIAVPAICVAHVSHQSIDEERFGTMTSRERYFLPSAAATRALSMGQQSFVADVFWLRAVLAYSDFMPDCSKEESVWLRLMLDTISSLDPDWRTTYFYGGTFMSVCDDTEGSDMIFEKGHKALPEDPYFPFSLSMNASEEHEDMELALHWMQIAAQMDSALPWYKEAVADLVEENNSREAAMKYLQEQMKRHNDPVILDVLQTRYNRKLHEQRVEEIASLRSLYEADGRQLKTTADLSMLRIPFEDPFDTEAKSYGWILSVDNQIRSRFIDDELAKKDRLVERELMMKDP